MTITEPARGLTASGEPDPRRWWTLAILCTSLLIVIVGNTSLNVALPTLSRTLGASTSALQWMVDAYSLVFAGMLLTAGTLGDRYGRKGALQFGLLLFLVATTSAAFAQSAAQVIVCRAVMGLAASFVMPSTLSILTNTFPARERAKAIAIWAGISASGAAIGPIASGFLLNHFWWGSVFLVNVPIVAIALIGGRFLVPASRDPSEKPLDLIGAAISVAGISALVYTIIEAPNRGWASAETFGWFLAAVVLLSVFVAWELHSEHPMLNLHFFRIPELSVACAGMTLVYFAMFGTFFLMTQYFQLVHNYSPFSAGLRQGPVAITMMLVAPNTPRLAAKYGRNKVVGAGLTIVSIGLLIFGRVDVGTSYWYLLGGMMVIAGGMAMTISPMTASIMSSVPLGQAGIGSALNDTTRELGGSLGVAVLGSLVVSRYTSRLAPYVRGLGSAARATANRSLSGALEVAGSDKALASAARHSFVSGMHLAYALGAAITAIAAIVASKLLPAARGGLAPNER